MSSSRRTFVSRSSQLDQVLRRDRERQRGHRGRCRTAARRSRPAPGLPRDRPGTPPPDHPGAVPVPYRSSAARPAAAPVSGCPRATGRAYTRNPWSTGQRSVPRPAPVPAGPGPGQRGYRVTAAVSRNRFPPADHHIRPRPDRPAACIIPGLPHGPPGLHRGQVRPDIVSGRAVVHHPAVDARPEACRRSLTSATTSPSSATFTHARAGPGQRPARTRPGAARQRRRLAAGRRSDSGCPAANPGSPAS